MNFRYFFAALFFTTFLQFQTQAQLKINDKVYQISGQTNSLEVGTEIKLYSFDPITQTNNELDKAVAKEDGTYNLSFLFENPDLYKVSFGRTQSVMLAIDKGQNDIQLNIEGTKGGFVRIEGSSDSEILQGYETFRKESVARLVHPTYATMREAKGDTKAEVAAVQAYGHASKEHRKELIDYALKNMGTSVALYGTMLRWTGDEEVANLEKLVGDFKAEHPEMPMTEMMENKLNRYKSVALGVIAPEIILPDSTGKTLNINDLKGKYTLIDFWASWCGPCLLQVPDLKEAYDDYHEKGFEIIGVSVDKKGKRWKNTIQKYEMNWPHLSDLKGWESKAARDYNVTFIPFNLLLDEEGRIIAKNLHSAELQEKLAELLGN